MKGDFDLLIKAIPGNDDITLYPISDLHIGASEFMQQKWNDFKNKIAKEPNSYLLLGGDLCNNATRSSVSNIFEETMRPKEQKRWLVEEFTPLRDKILCAVSGNHCRRSEKDADDNPMYDVMCKLDLEDIYQKDIAFLKIQIGNTKENGTRNPTYTIAVTHGAGGGIYTGAAVNRNERFQYVIDGLDCLVVGHTHKGVISKPQKIKIDPFNNRVTFSQCVVVSSTSWMQFGGYALQKMLIPASNDLQTIVLKGNKKQIVANW